MRSLLCLAAAAAVTLATPAFAAPFSFLDPLGDAGSPGLDIVRVTYSLTRRQDLVVRMDLAGPPVGGAGVRYYAQARFGACGGLVVFNYSPGTVYAATASAGNVEGSDGVPCGDPASRAPRAPSWRRPPPSAGPP